MNRTKPIWTLTSLACIALMCGCASIVSKSQYPVSITSQPSGADIVVQDDAGKTYLNGKTPTTVTLAAGAGYFKGKNYTVTFAKPGYAKHTAEIKRGVDGWYIAGNFVFGGLIGWLIVDPATGAMWTLPKEVTATLSPETSMIQKVENIHIVSMDQVPSHLREQMVRVN